MKRDENRLARKKRAYVEHSNGNGHAAQPEVLQHLPISPEAARLLKVIEMRSQGHSNVTRFEQRDAAKHPHG